jgi:peptide/nickel transport system ATP-binding protein
LNTSFEHGIEAHVTVKDLKKYYPVRQSFMEILRSKDKLFVHAVDGVSFHINFGEILCLAGESGSGKTTTGRILARLESPSDGKIVFRDKDIGSLKGEELKSFRKEVQMIFQNPFESLDPRDKVLKAISEPLDIHKLCSKDEKFDTVCKMLETVELVPPEAFLDRLPHELSGGQRQRVALARALILQPQFIVADEPVSMMDVSLRAGILNLMLRLQENMNLTSLFITHDLSIARYMGDRLAIMYLGEIVEIAPTEKIIQSPQHPYSELLVSSIPVPDPTYQRKPITTSYNIPSSIHLPRGCRFHPRCPYSKDVCREKEPELQEFQSDWFVACNL